MPKFSYKLCLVLLAAITIQSCTSHQSQGTAAVPIPGATADVSEANKAFKRGDYKNAADIYAKLLEASPDNQNIAFYYAESLRMGGKTGDAITQYDKILDKSQGTVPAIEGKGLAYLQDGNLNKALEYLNSAIEKDSSRWRTLNAIGVVYSINGNSNEAENYYKMALEVSKDNPAVINNIALSAAINGDKAKGIKLLEEALDTLPDASPRKATIENNLAMLYGMSGDMDQAEKILRRNLPESAVYNNLGYYAKLASDKKLAWSYLSKAVSESPVYYEKAWNNMQGLSTPGTDDTNTVKPVNVADAMDKKHKDKIPVPHLRP